MVLGWWLTLYAMDTDQKESYSMIFSRPPILQFLLYDMAEQEGSYKSLASSCIRLVSGMKG